MLFILLFCEIHSLAASLGDIKVQTTNGLPENILQSVTVRVDPLMEAVREQGLATWCSGAETHCRCCAR